MRASGKWSWVCVVAVLVLCVAAENGCVGPDEEPTSCLQILWRDCDNAFVASLVTPANNVTGQAAYIRESVLVSVDDGSTFSYCYSEYDDNEEASHEACLNLTDIAVEGSDVSLCATVTVPEISQTVDYGCWSSAAAGAGSATCGEVGYFNYPCDYHFENVDEVAVVEESHEDQGPWYLSEDNCVVFSSEEVLACPTFYADTCGSRLHFSSSYGYFWMHQVDLDTASAVDYTVNDNGCIYIFQLSNVDTADSLEKLSVHLKVTADLSAEQCLQTVEYPPLEFGELQYGFPACGESHDSCSSKDGSMTWFFVALGIVCLILLAFACVGALTLAMRLLAKQRKKPMYITDDEELAMQEEPGIFDDVEDDEPPFDF